MNDEQKESITVLMKTIQDAMNESNLPCNMVVPSLVESLRQTLNNIFEAEVPMENFHESIQQLISFIYEHEQTKTEEHHDKQST